MLAGCVGGSGFDSQHAIRPSVVANTCYPNAHEMEARRSEIQAMLGYLEYSNPYCANVSLSELNNDWFGKAIWLVRDGTGY